MWQWTGYVGDAKEAKVVVDLVFLQILSNTMLLTFFMIQEGGILAYLLYIVSGKFGTETNEIVEYLLDYYTFFIGGVNYIACCAKDRLLYPWHVYGCLQ